MRIAVIDGYTEHCGDWNLASNLRSLGFVQVDEFECEQNIGIVNEAAVADIVAADALAMYSFGVATGWDETGGWKRLPEGKKFKLGVLVAGVLDWTKGQFSGWTAPKCFHRMYCFQPTRAFPVSQPLVDAPWFGINDVDLKAKLAATLVANINCDALFVGEWNPISMHTRIQNDKAVLDLVAWMFENLCGVEAVA